MFGRFCRAVFGESIPKLGSIRPFLTPTKEFSHRIPEDPYIMRRFKLTPEGKKDLIDGGQKDLVDQLVGGEGHYFPTTAHPKKPDEILIVGPLTKSELVTRKNIDNQTITEGTEVLMRNKLINGVFGRDQRIVITYENSMKIAFLNNSKKCSFEIDVAKTLAANEPEVQASIDKIKQKKSNL